MKLWQARALFTELVCTRLIPKAIELGFYPGLDEGMERLTERDPTSDHMKNSLHHMGLAQDIILWTQDGEYISRTAQYEELGLFWESLHHFCRWGGRFSDGNHFSFAPTNLVGNRK